jgi:hypothetical protein
VAFWLLSPLALLLLQNPVRQSSATAANAKSRRDRSQSDIHAQRFFKNGLA